MKKVKLITTLSLSAIAITACLLTTSCKTKGKGKDPTNYVGNWDGKDWIGYRSGSLVVDELEENEISITSNDNYQADNLIIPSKIKLSRGEIKSLTEVASGAFYNSTTIAGHITLPNSITSIGDHAFFGCYYIGTLTLSNSLTFIDDYAFYGCTLLNLINASYTAQPNWDNTNIFSVAASGTVRNTGKGYSSVQFLTYLKTKGLSDRWVSA